MTKKAYQEEVETEETAATHNYFIVTAVEVQGRYDEGRGMEFARAFKVEYWRPSLQGWASYKSEENTEVWTGLRLTSTSIIHQLITSITSQWHV
ncbi:unnamed protein product [Strongylus vulgaris]|uniref:F5/8 type C domain-containing protein n=1 Tax=Strongylus vulgaris TaxID=40348 RepID=A0A3P7L0K7_STRVU|nr:unnamed protein product [Strongylus vulgaris]